MRCNEDRIQAAEEALAVIDGDTEQEVLTDLLANLMHWSADAGTDFERALLSARMHFEAERDEEAAPTIYDSRPEQPGLWDWLAQWPGEAKP